jgi:hypothetical protein
MTLWHVHRTFVNVIFEDGLGNVPAIGDLLRGHLSFGDLAPFFGEHLLIGYRMLILLNAKFLSLDMRLDPIMFVAASAVTASLLYAGCLKVFSNVRRALLVPIFLPLGFLCFSLVAPPEMLMTTQFVWGTVVALAIAWLLQRDFDTSGRERDHPRPRWQFIAVFVLIPVYFAVFSGAYFPGLMLGLFAMYAFRALLKRAKWFEVRTVAVLALVVVSALAYTYVLVTVEAQQQAAASGGIGHFFADFGTTLLSYVAGVGSGLIDQHTLTGTSPSVLLAVGGVMVAIGLVAMWLFVRTKMYLKTYLPVYCIFYSLGIVTSVRMGRGLLGGWGWIANEWYSFHLRFFIIGVAWILLYAFVECVRRIRVGEVRLFQRASWPIALVLVAVLFVGACQVAANGAQWKRGPWVRQWLADKRQALLYPGLYENPADVLLWPQAEVEKDRAILAKYSLSSFATPGWASLNPASRLGLVRSTGWYQDDWIGRSGRAVYNAQSAGSLQFEEVVPGFIHSNHVEVRLNGKLVFESNVTGGSAPSFTGRIRKGANLITVTCAQAVSPASLGINSDVRLLAIRLSVHRL